MKINILGTEYGIKRQTAKENCKLDDASGLCEVYSKEIIIDTSGKDDKMAFNKLDDFFHKVLRHEGFHAIFAEAGASQYMDDETLVDMLAMLYPKIKAIMEQLDGTDIESI